MPSFAGLVAGFLQTILSIFGLAHANPAVPPGVQDWSTRIEQKAVQETPNTNPIAPVNVPTPKQESAAPAQPVTSSDISVPGMSKYTDPDFGFSFWYPSVWKFEDVHPVETDMARTLDGESVVKELAMPYTYAYLGPGYGPPTTKTIRIFEVSSPARTISNQGTGKTLDVRNIFDTSSHTWMATYGDSKPYPADVSVNSMGGLHMLRGGESTIVPLSATSFLIFDLEYFTYLLNPLIHTVVVTDPSVATLVNVAEQIKTIQAERDAYAGQ